MVRRKNCALTGSEPFPGEWFARSREWALGKEGRASVRKEGG